jgi:hypothetical protein
LLDEGIMFNRGTGLTQAFIWDETNDTFALIGTNDDHTVIGSVNIDSYSNLRVGGITTSNITITDGAANGYLLQSDASGNATWLSATSASANFANTDLTLTGNRIHNTNGNDLIISTDGTGNDFVIGFQGTQSLSVGHVNYFQEFTTSDLSIQQFGGTRRLEINATETIFGTINNNFDFIIKGNTNENLFFVDASTDRVGIGTASPAYLFQIVGGNGSTFYFDPTSGGGRYNLLGTTGVPRYDVSIPAYLSNLSTGGSVGMRTWDDSTYTGYGQVGDMHVYAGNTTNGLNIINSPGASTEDYIRFYAGQVATGTADIHIQGDGSTRGFVGIGLTAPSYKLEVSGTVSTIGFRMNTGASNGYVLTSDASGNATWQAASGGGTTPTLSQVLATGNTSSGNDILISDGDYIAWKDDSFIGRIIVNNSGFTTNRSFFLPDDTGSLVLGTGSTNYIPKWSSSTGLTNSLIYDNGSTIFIGQTTSATDTLLYLREFNSSIRTGIYTEVSSSTSFNVGISSNVGSGIGFGSGDYAIVGNIGTSTASDSYSIYARNTGSSTTKYGTYNTVTGNGTSTTNYGSYNLVSGANTNNFGIYNVISGTYGNKYGMYTIMTGQGDNYGQYTALSSTGSSNYGLFISSSGATNNWGVFVQNGTSVLNNSGNANSDFRIAGEFESNLFFADASTNRIGVKTSLPTYDFTVSGTVSSTGLYNNGGLRNKITDPGANPYTITTNDYILRGQPSGGYFTFSLPTTPPIGTEIIITKQQGGTVSIVSTGDTMAGGNSGGLTAINWNPGTYGISKFIYMGGFWITDAI